MHTRAYHQSNYGNYLWGQDWEWFGSVQGDFHLICIV